MAKVKEMSSSTSNKEQQHHDSAAHEALLAAIRKLSQSCFREPPHEEPEAGEGGLWQQLQSWKSLVTAMLRTRMVRSSVLALTGDLVLVLPWLLGLEGARYYLLVLSGLSLILTAVFCKIPGGVDFLKVNTTAGWYGSEADQQTATRNTQLRHAFNYFLSNRYFATPWITHGEWCTVLPFLMHPNRARHLLYERMWVETEDSEHIAVDWIFPPQGHDPSKPIVVLLTGLAPSQHWTETGGFVADAARFLSEEKGITAVVMIARGTMDTEVKENSFNGARVSDLHSALKRMQEATELAAASSSGSGSGSGSTGAAAAAAASPPIFAAGYSMGAIILGNYCSTYGAETRVRGIIHFSGVYDAVYNMKFEYCRRTWQVYLAHGLKTAFYRPRVRAAAARKGIDLSKIFDPAAKIESVQDFDEFYVAPFNGFKDVVDYYQAMSTMPESKASRVSIPTLAVAARDDPITHCDALHAKRLSELNPNLLFLITERGGHVGWPWGWLPWRKGFDFMNEAIALFVETCVLSSAASNEAAAAAAATTVGSKPTCRSDRDGKDDEKQKTHHEGKRERDQADADISETSCGSPSASAATTTASAATASA